MAMLDSADRPPDAMSGGCSPTGYPSDVQRPDPTWTRQRRSARLADLLMALPPGSAEVRGDANVRIDAISYRSADARPGTLFFCVPGRRVDGHAFAAAAVAGGASALVVDRWLDVPAAAQVRVAAVRPAMGPIAASFYGRPWERLTTVGVTGTNGKTTTTYLLESIFNAAGVAAGVVGTTGVRIAGRPVPFDRTTPEAPDLQRLLAEMADAGVAGVAMEVSSHGLDQHRVDGTRFTEALFTNLSQDHLDYHPSMDAYFTAKARLFTPQFARSGVVNVDDPWGRRLTGLATIPVVTFGLEPGADVVAKGVSISPDGLRFRVGTLEVRSRLRASHNVSNCLGAVVVARRLEIDDRAIVDGIASLGDVPGRLEPVEAGQPFAVFVDYAHTPDSLDIVLRAVRPLATGRVIVVFGCGGDRDRGKRPLMGEAATANADLAIVTSDNPRSEDPAAIIAEILPGAEAAGGAFVVEPDRRAAIRLALGEARAGDVLVIAGKGHETGQEFADRTVPFDDRIVVREELMALEAPAAETRPAGPSRGPT
jgi:UDP-N-acetylmuramoyl-L-alanyl-D-glutamate--2,6-diaminopimelate ligase